MFQETMREFNYNLRTRLVNHKWVLERKIAGIWVGIKDDRGKSYYTGVSDAVIALSRISKKVKPQKR